MTGLLALLAAAVTVAYATPTNASGCARVDVMKNVFPKARTVGFKTHWRVARTRHRRGDPEWSGWCGNWYTTYTDYRGVPRRQGARPYRAFAEVYVSLYKTHRDALVALGEPAYGPIRTLPNGVRMRTLVSRPSVNGDASRQVGWVGSVVERSSSPRRGKAGGPPTRERGRPRATANPSPHPDGCPPVALRRLVRTTIEILRGFDFPHFS